MDEIKDRVSQLRKTQAPLAFHNLQDAVTEHVETFKSECMTRI